jgi:hypothetical protein
MPEDRQVTFGQRRRADARDNVSARGNVSIPAIFASHLTYKNPFVDGHFPEDLTPFSSKRYMPFTRSALKCPVTQG